MILKADKQFHLEADQNPIVGKKWREKKVNCNDQRKHQLFLHLLKLVFLELTAKLDPTKHSQLLPTYSLEDNLSSCILTDIERVTGNSWAWSESNSKKVFCLIFFSLRLLHFLVFSSKYNFRLFFCVKTRYLCVNP